MKCEPTTTADSVKQTSLNILLTITCFTLNTDYSGLSKTWSCGVEVITSALHAEGPQFDPGRDQKF